MGARLIVMPSPADPAVAEARSRSERIAELYIKRCGSVEDAMVFLESMIEKFNDIYAALERKVVS
jgi:hypothetical protein